MKLSELSHGKCFKIPRDHMEYEVAKPGNFNAEQVVTLEGPKDVVYALSKDYPSDRIYKFHPDQQIKVSDESDD